jgi:hypothetical protein
MSCKFKDGKPPENLLQPFPGGFVVRWQITV